MDSPGAVVTAVGDDRYEAWVRLDREPIPAGLATAMGQALNDRYTDGGPDGAPVTGSLAAGFVDTPDPLTRMPEGRGLYVDVASIGRDVAPGAAALRAELLEHMRLPKSYFTRAEREAQSHRLHRRCPRRFSSPAHTPWRRTDPRLFPPRTRRW